MFREESDLQKKHTGVRRERHDSLFFNAGFKENFFYNLHEGFFFFKLYVLMVINKNVL